MICYSQSVLSLTVNLWTDRPNNNHEDNSIFIPNDMSQDKIRIY